MLAVFDGVDFHAAVFPRFDESAKLSLGMVASPQSPLPFYLAIRLSIKRLIPAIQKLT